MKKGLFVLVSMMLVLLWAGCGNDKSSNHAWDDVVSYAIASGFAVSGGKCVYLDDALLCVKDVATNTSTILCSRTNCKHEPYDSESNPNPECEAAPQAGGIMFSAVGLYKDTVYEYVATENPNETIVCSKKLGAFGWSKLATIPYDVTSACDSYYIDGCAYFVGSTKTPMGDDQQECEETSVILKMNLDTGALEELGQRCTSLYQSEMEQLLYSDGKLCYELVQAKQGCTLQDYLECTQDNYWDMHNVSIGILDLATQEEMKVDFRNWSNLGEFRGFESGNIYYKEQQKLYVWNMDTQETKVFCDLKKDQNAWAVAGYGMELQAGADEIEFYSFAQEEWITIEKSGETDDVAEDERVSETPLMFYGDYVLVAHLQRITQDEGAQLEISYNWIPFAQYRNGVR